MSDQVRVLVVVGTRPEAIKLACLISALRRDPRVRVRVCATGQHREMVDGVLEQFGILPDDDFDIMASGRGQSITTLTTAVLEHMQPLLADWRPHRVIVQGDTTSAFAAALAAAYARVPVAHVEAGLRTGNPLSPWPEEHNRRLIAGIADIHFAPTTVAREHLIAEGIPPASIHVTGNTCIDALLHMRSRIETDASLAQQLAQEFGFLDTRRRLLLVTAHRRESFGSGLDRICEALRRLARREDVQIVFPVHLNPQVREPVHRALSALRRVTLLPPVDYARFVWLMLRSHLILSDSGGIQEEAPSLGRPVLVMRDHTERSEAVAAGAVRVVGTEVERIVEGACALLDDPIDHARMARAKNPYGDGRASERILEIVCARVGTALPI